MATQAEIKRGLQLLKQQTEREAHEAQQEEANAKCQAQLDAGVKSWAEELEKAVKADDVYDFLDERECGADVTCDLSGDISKIKVWLGVGGPSYYLDLRYFGGGDEVQGVWSGLKAHAALSDEASEAIWDYYTDLFKDCVRAA